MNQARRRENSPRFQRIRHAIATGVNNRMDTQIIALLMFLLLTYLLFRRPAPAMSRRGPTELNFQIRRHVHLKANAPGARGF